MTAVAAEVVEEQGIEEVVLAPRPRPARPVRKLDAAGRRALLEEHAGLAMKWASACKRKARELGLEIEELAQVAYIGLDDASRHYDPALGPFARYAWGYAKRRIVERLREERQARGTFYEGEAGLEGPGDEDEGAPRPSNAEEIAWLIACIHGPDALEAAVVCRLDDWDRAILDAVRLGRKQAETAVEVGCGLSTLQHRQRSLILKLREIVGRHL